MKNHFEIHGETTTIFLRRKNGHTLKTLISTCDIEKVSDVSWHASWDSKLKSFYVHGTKRESGKKITLLLHRVVLDAPNGLLVDHRNHDTLDNRRENIRLVTASENGQNRMVSKNNSSGCVGVYWDNYKKKWRGRIRLKDRKPIHIGWFDTKEEAAIKMREARKKLLPYSLEAIQGG